MTGIYKNYPPHLKTVGDRAKWDVAQQLGMSLSELKPIADIFMAKSEERFGKESVEKSISRSVDSFTDNGAESISLGLKLFVQDYQVRGDAAELPVLRM